MTYNNTFVVAADIVTNQKFDILPNFPRYLYLDQIIASGFLLLIDFGKQTNDNRQTDKPAAKQILEIWLAKTDDQFNHIKI